MTLVRLVVLAAAIAVTAGGALLLRRRRRSAPLGRPETWSCECGQSYRVSGTGRHRVYWLEGAAQNDPVISGACPSCDRALPTSG